MTATTGTDRRWQMTMPTTVSHSQVVTSRGTEHLLHELEICYKFDQIFKFASMQVCCAMKKLSVRDKERVKRIGQCVSRSVSRRSEDTSLGSREQSAGSAGSRVASWKRTQTLAGEATKPLDDRCRPESP